MDEKWERHRKIDMFIEMSKNKDGYINPEAARAMAFAAGYQSTNDDLLYMSSAIYAHPKRPDKK